MDTQKETFRADDDSISDKNTDVTRSQNREGASQSNVAGDTSSGEGSGAAHGHHGGNETGSHQEGAYDKDHLKPLVDEEEL